MNTRTLVLVVAAVLGSACGKDKGGGGGGGDKGGPSCADAAAKYVDLDVTGGGNELSGLKPTPDQIKAVTALIKANCEAGWSADTKTCVLATKSNFETGKCWTDSMDRARVDQVIFDFAKAEKAKGGGAAAGSGSAAAGSGSAAP